MVPQVEIEHSLIEIKKCKIDKLILNRKNETLCQENNEEIERLNKVIETNEKKLEEQLKLSGKKKIEVKLGYCSYRAMPDKWDYDDQIILAWCKQYDMPYFHTVELVERNNLKKAILGGDVKLEDVQVEDSTTKDYQRKSVQGVTVSEQEPKFNYKIKGGL